MLNTSLIVELLRSQPRLAFWVATLAQAALWWLVPSLFYSSPPGELPLVLAIGHEFRLGSSFGPPLAFWAAEVAFDIVGAPGVYLLAQACIIFAYYGVFTLARAIVGTHHATFAILLMAGIFAFTAPTPNFGPAVLAIPFTVFAILNLWRAVGERRPVGWFLLALQLGLLLLTTYAGLALTLAIVIFLAVTRRGRRALRSADPWLASIIIVVVLFPHLIWLDLAGDGLPHNFGLPTRTNGSYPSELLAFIEVLIFTHAGLLVLVGLGRKWHFRSDEKVPVFMRSFTDPFGRRFVYFFAVAPALIAALFGGLSGARQTSGTLAPYLVLSGLAVVVLAGNAIPWHRPRLLAIAWSLILAVPPLGAAAAIIVLPWLGVSGMDVARPAATMGRFFAENFERRTGTPLAIVAGEPGTAAFVALGAPTRPSLYLDATPDRTPWVTAEDVRRKGAVVVWPNDDTRAQVPADIATRFPGLVADVPRAFEFMVQGRLPLWRVGWGVVRPQVDAPKETPDAPKP
jgi:hypothetical protein